MGSVKRLWLAVVRAVRRVTGILRKPPTIAALRQALRDSARSFVSRFDKPRVAVKVRSGWCMRHGWHAPGECVFLDVVNWGEQPVSIEKIGVSIEGGKDVDVEPEVVHPPLPYEMQGRQRRVFSVATGDLVERMGENWITLDVVAAFVTDANGVRYQGKVPNLVTEKLRAEYFVR